MSGTKIIPIPVLGKHAVNAYLLLGRRPVLVDAGTPGSGQRIHERIAGHGVDPSDLALIVITHGHIDHFGSAAELHRLTGAPVAGHVADLEPFRTGQARMPHPGQPARHVRPEPHEAPRRPRRPARPRARPALGGA
ncbi:MBL fold metallo-hydrolase [Streptomyces antarcticus]|uniref:MBL fold metallo-hydrolase n=1 Tax=Streptomyces antarcticus TaxID=2996458 RepID=UPI00226EEFB5|nr:MULTISPECIES: MBL fold metallo-hydrolase [unclassified Streptomyces]MCY0941425.1 MBL fold metallo-hydrolase [Streptomyces sp. H34-AA3]MCZ4085061.1 MBL fold metallo-hydrolase [Streptomyces sp. H34-S5]